jgi:HEAT repeat protein
VKKRKAAKAIGELGKPARSASPALVTILEKDRDALVRHNAAEALGKIGGETKTVVAALGRAMRDSDQDVMTAAAMALANFGRASVPELRMALKEKDNLVRKNAAEAIAKIGPDAKDAVEDLVNALKTERPAMRRRDNSFKASYVEALGAIGPDAKAAVKYLEESIAERNVDREYRRVVTEALRKIKKSS